MGNVVAAAVILPPVTEFPDDRWTQIKDSKKLSAKKRRELAAYIQQHAVAWAIGEATPREIDRWNILRATLRAMHRACDIVYKKARFDRILVDGPHFEGYQPPGLDVDIVEHECIEQGDSVALSIAAASIVAKDFRDTAIAELVRQHPELEAYSIHKNMGYGTAAHMKALQDLGPTPFHRASFGPVARALGKEMSKDG